MITEKCQMFLTPLPFRYVLAGLSPVDYVIRAANICPF